MNPMGSVLSAVLRVLRSQNIEPLMENFSKLNNFDLMPPPRVTMDEYCDWVLEMLQRIPESQIDEQKKREKQIKVAFHF